MVVIFFCINSFPETKEKKVSEYFIVKIDEGIKNPLANINIDELFEKVSDTIGIMLLPSFRGTIEIRNTDALTVMVLGEDFPKQFSKESVKSCYIMSKKTIILAGKTYKHEHLVHEMAHALINNYFINCPSEKTQEILAGWAEHQICIKKK